MKNSIIALLLIVSLTPGIGGADDKDYSICEIAGFYEGDGNRFLYELALRIVDKNRLGSESECSVAMKNGKDVAIKFLKPGKSKTEEDSRILGEAAHFSNVVYDAILSRVKFD